MDSQRWRQIEEILDRVLEAPETEQKALLDRSCAGDPELRAEVEALLAADRDATGLLESPAADYAATLLEADRAAESQGFEGRELGPYRILQRIGGGGMGVVYEAEDTRLGRRVAIKLLPEEWSRHPDAKARFLLEARAASSIDHPNVCTIHDLGESDGGQLFLVMSLVRGETLKERLDRGPLPIADAVDLAAQIARGLEPAHTAGIVHRDIKPANVMVTDSGDGLDAKILDFGIARVAGEAGLTRTGGSLGTPYYMSPEQASSRPVDARTDVWSLGVVLYEMLAGQRPFEGDNQLAVLRAITDDEPEPLRHGRTEVAESLARIVDRALAKDPGERHQTVAELRRDLESGIASQPSKATGRRYRLVPTLVILTILLVAFVAWWMPRQRSATSAPPRTATASQADPASTENQPAKIAVLSFQNLTGDSELDWMRRGISEMLVTDLAQSPEIEVVSTRRLFQILDTLDATEAAPSLETIRSVARMTGAGNVILGNFVRLGDMLQVALSVERAEDGELLQSASFEGRGEESLFAIVDELSAAIRNRFEIRAHPESAATVEDVTTSSIQAWRLYTEGLALYQRAKFTEAVPLLEQAIEIDPEFALALSTLGRLYQNLRRPALERHFTERAVAQAARLPLDRRYAIEGTYYATEWTTVSRAVEAFSRAVELYPERTAPRSNLAQLLMFQERYEEALEHYEVLIRQRTDFAPTYFAAANAHAALGRQESGYRLVADIARRTPDEWFPQIGLAWYAMLWNKTDEAAQAIEKAAGLRPAETYVHYSGWRLAVLTEDWRQAENEAENLLALDEDYSRWLGATSKARNSLYEGRSEAALAQLTAATRAYAEPGSFTALAHAWAAEVLWARGDTQAALDQASRAQELGRQQWPEVLGLFVTAAIQTERGDGGSASEDELRRRWQAHPNPVEERGLLRLDALRASTSGDVERAVEVLRRAAALLPARGLEIHPQILPDHLTIWLDLGLAELAAGRPEAARRHFLAVTRSGDERIHFPIPWARGHFHLATAQRQLGDPHESRRALERFLDLWRDGDLDRHLVQEAEARLSTEATRLP